MSESATDDGIITVREAVGGDEHFVRLIDRFFDRVARDDLLMSMYPADLTDSRRHMVLFLSQYWGGEPEYSLERGHPRLRARHAPFPVDGEARDVWVRYMMEAIDDELIVKEIRDRFVDYFDHAATAMINQHGR